jgi:hypothetical protein
MMRNVAKIGVHDMVQPIAQTHPTTSFVQEVPGSTVQQRTLGAPQSQLITIAGINICKGFLDLVPSAKRITRLRHVVALTRTSFPPPSAYCHGAPTGVGADDNTIVLGWSNSSSQH